MEETITGRGQRATVELPDGSRAILAAESRLRYPASAEHWRDADRARDLYLEGQAYFEVQHDSTRAFRVHTATGVVEDLGTEFVVAAYPETHGTLVAVVAGVVALYRAPVDTAVAAASGAEAITDADARAGTGETTGAEAIADADAGAGAGETTRIEATGERDAGGGAEAGTRAEAAHEGRLGRPLLVLSRGDVARLDTSGKTVLTRDVNLAPYVAWTDWNLVFDATPMHEVVATLARWYDLDITLATAPWPSAA